MKDMHNHAVQDQKGSESSRTAGTVGLALKAEPEMMEESKDLASVGNNMMKMVLSTNEPKESPSAKRPPSSLPAQQELNKPLHALSGRVDSVAELGKNVLNVRDAAKGFNGAILRLEDPKTVMIIGKTQDARVVCYVRELTKFLLRYSHCEETNLDTCYVQDQIAKNPAMGYAKLKEEFGDRLQKWNLDLCRRHPEKIDFVVTLGGDGTVLYAAWLFQKNVPPIVPFHMGSLGFLTIFKITEVEQVLESLLGCHGKGIKINMRMRLSCTVNRYRKPTHLAPTPTLSGLNLGGGRNSATSLSGPEKEVMEYELSKFTVPSESFQILNEIVIDRGPSAYMSQLELFVDKKHLTSVQADGLVVATPTGSTAYSLSAGGSLAHPQVPSFLLTPICAHSLSFRPMLLPDSIELTIQIPLDSRNTAWVAFDGRERCELRQGDHITVSLSRSPVPTVCSHDQSTDWFESLKKALHWNKRVRQKGFSDQLEMNDGVCCEDDEDLAAFAKRIFSL